MGIIEYSHVAVAYDDKVVVRDFNLLVKPGEFLTIIGTSGCGKTTVLKLANGLIRPTSGTVCIDSHDTKHMDLTLLRRHTGYVIQGNALFPHMTVEKNIAYVPNLLNGRDEKRTAQAVRKWLAIVGLEEALLQRYPRELSGGQQQRVGIARALAASPDVLLMDEPFGAVDEITRRSLQSEIRRIHAETGITIMFVTHDIREALLLGSQVLVMDKGEIQQLATPDMLRQQPANDYVCSFMVTGY